MPRREIEPKADHVVLDSAGVVFRSGTSGLVVVVYARVREVVNPRHVAPGPVAHDRTVPERRQLNTRYGEA